MSKLDELIHQLCPDGVEWKTLNDIGEFFGGLTGKSKNDFIDGNAAFITYSNIYSNPSLNLNIDEKVRIDDGEKQNVIQYGDILFTGSSETPEECGMSSVVTKEPTEKMYLNSFSFGLRLFELDKFNSDYLKHLFRSAEIRKEICKTANGVTRFNVSKKKMGEIAIPHPPLPVQEEIVRILDTFTESTNNLKEQIQTRRKQYEYYRNQLLDLEGKEGVEIRTIGSITKVFSASRVHKNEWTKNGVPFWRSSDLMSFFNGIENPKGKAYISHELYEKLSAKSGKICKDDILVTGGGSIGIPYIVPNNNPLYVKDADLLCIVHNKCFKSKYLYYYMLSTRFRNYFSDITHNEVIAHYTISQINTTPIPLPSLSEQERIVSILDQFEASIANLEAQLKEREKQYEYYRNQLLDFKKKEE